MTDDEPGGTPKDRPDPDTRDTDAAATPAPGDAALRKTEHDQIRDAAPEDSPRSGDEDAAQARDNADGASPASAPPTGDVAEPTEAAASPEQPPAGGPVVPPVPRPPRAAPQRLRPPGFSGPAAPILGAPIPGRQRPDGRRALLASTAIVVILALVGAAIYLIIDRNSSTNASSGNGGPATPTPASSSDGSGGPSSGTPAGRASAVAGTDPALRRFYDQPISWHSCGGQTQCTTFAVPLDYTQPTGRTITLTMARQRATDQSHRIGALIYNPGGPGGSAVTAVESGGVTSPTVASRFDVIGLDPRGVGSSSPLSCVSDSQVDQLVGEDPAPSTPDQINGVVSETQFFDNACKQAEGSILPFVGTENAARDMDVARALLGEDKLYYFGQSYGTYLGTVYAGLFPQRVGRLALDGAIDPALTGRQEDLDQARGFETELDAFVANCITQPSCPVGTTQQAGIQRIQTFLSGLDTNPLPGDQTRKLTRALATTGVIGSLYADESWPQLRQALSSALGGDGSQLLSLADQYNERGPNGTYYSNIMQVNPAVNCVDRGDDTTVAEIQADLPQFVQASPTFGAALDWGGLVCSYWPVKPEITPGPITAHGAAPILVVGTTRDPATPYTEAQALSSELPSAVLLTWNADGHTAYGRGSTCIDSAVDTYLLTGHTPPPNTTCQGRS